MRLTITPSARVEIAVAALAILLIAAIITGLVIVNPVGFELIVTAAVLAVIALLAAVPST
jgi:hypothetical protein